MKSLKVKNFLLKMITFYDSNLITNKEMNIGLTLAQQLGSRGDNEIVWFEG